MAIIVALVLALGWSLWRAESHKGRADRAQEAVERTNAALTSERAARANEHKAADKMAEIGDKHEEDRTAAEAVPAAVVAELRAGNLRLRQQWQACDADRVSDLAAAATERHAAAVSREADFGNLVRAGRDADDQLRACQAVIQADREAP